MVLANLFVQAVLWITAVFHLLPVAGVLGPQRLLALYGLPFDQPLVLLLMRHRAVLFGAVAVLLIGAARLPMADDAAAKAGWTAGHLQVAAMAVALVSTASFVALAWGLSLNR